MKRCISILLLFSTIVSTAACGTGGTGDDTTTVDTTIPADTTAPPSRVSSLPDEYDLEGYNFRVIRQDPANIAWSLNIFGTEEENGDNLNDVVHRRNVAVMEKYNFTIEETITAADPKSNLINAVMSGEDLYDIALITLNNSSGLFDGVTLDVTTVPNLDLDAGWWNQGMIRDLSISGKLFMLTGDILLSDNDSMLMMMYNRPMADEYNMENLYDIVREGKWTYDKMNDMMKLVTADLNADGKEDVNDRYGLLYVNNSAIEPYFASAGAYLFRFENGEPVFTGNSERAISIFETMQTIYNTDFLAYDWNDMGSTAGQQIVTMIDDDRVLFQNMVLSFVRRFFRDVENNFGLVPRPKLDESQETYSTLISLATPYIFIPATVSEPEKTGFVLEALAFASEEVTETYYSVCMESKYTRDEESYEMIKLAQQNIIYDPGFVYNWGSLGSNIRTAVMGSSQNYASLLASFESAAKAAAEKFVEEIAE